MVGLVVIVFICLWIIFEFWRAPLLKENQDGTWTTVREAKKLSDLFKKRQ